MNITLGGVQSKLAFVTNTKNSNSNDKNNNSDNTNDDIFEMQLQQKIGSVMVNCIDCQGEFNQSILRLEENKVIHILVGVRYKGIVGLLCQERDINNVNVKDNNNSNKNNK